MISDILSDASAELDKHIDSGELSWYSPEILTRILFVHHQINELRKEIDGTLVRLDK